MMKPSLSPVRPELLTNLTWRMTNPFPKHSVAWCRFNMRLAALDWRYWITRDQRKSKEWLAIALGWRKTAFDRATD